MTAANLLLRVRDLIQDSVTTYRHDDTKLLRYLNDGVRVIYGKHPSAAYVSGVSTTAPSELTQTSETVPLTDPWLIPLEHFISWMVFAEDTEDSADKQLAVLHKQQFDMLNG